MHIYQKWIENALANSKNIINEYKNRTDGLSFKEWMEEFFENVSSDVLNKYNKNTAYMQDYKSMLPQLDLNDEDEIELKKTYTNERGNVVQKDVKYSKKQLAKDYVEAQDYNERVDKIVFETELGAYIAAKQKIDARPWYSKAFFFIRTYKESKMLDQMKQEICNKYRIDENQLDTTYNVATNPGALEETDYIDAGGHRFLREEYQFDNIEETRQNMIEGRKVKLSELDREKIDELDEEIFDKIDADKIDKRLEDFKDSDIEDLSFSKDDIIINNNEEIADIDDEFNKDDLIEGESKNEKTAKLRLFLSENLEEDDKKIYSNKYVKPEKKDINIEISNDK